MDSLIIDSASGFDQKKMLDGRIHVDRHVSPVLLPTFFIRGTRLAEATEDGEIKANYPVRPLHIYRSWAIVSMLNSSPSKTNGE